MIRVAVIGAGAAGLCVARYMVSQPEMFSPVVFEQTGSIGGTWVYTEETGNDSNGIPIHSSMYYNLRTNLPKEVMAFPGFPFPTDWRSYMHHTQVLKYLRSYSTHFGVDNVVHLNTVVTRVHPVKCGDGEKVTWEVTVRKVDEQKSLTSQFDAVVVCNGHYSQVYIPDIPGVGSFKGRVLHSHNYRHQEDFQGMKIVILGAKSSGTDIALELANTAQKVFLSHSNPVIESKLPDNIEQLLPIESVRPDGTVQFMDGQTREADAIMLCTGYVFSFPFFSSECQVQLLRQEKQVFPLYKHVFHTGHPSLSFIGIPSVINPFPLFSVQARAIVAVLSGNIPLPSHEDMDKDIAKDLEEKVAIGWPERHAHKLGDKQFQYNDDMADFAGCERIHPVVQNLYEHRHKWAYAHLAEFKNEEFCIVDQHTWAYADRSDKPHQ